SFAGAQSSGNCASRRPHCPGQPGSFGVVVGGAAARAAPATTSIAAASAANLRPARMVARVYKPQSPAHRPREGAFDRPLDRPTEYRSKTPFFALKRGPRVVQTWSWTTRDPL